MLADKGRQGDIYIQQLDWLTIFLSIYNHLNLTSVDFKVTYNVVDNTSVIDRKKSFYLSTIK